MNLFIERKVSKSGKSYIALYCEAPKGDKFITFDPSVMCRLSGLSWLDIKDINIGEKIIL